MGAGRKDPTSVITAALPLDNILDGCGKKGERKATESQELPERFHKVMSEGGCVCVDDLGILGGISEDLRA